VAQGDLRDDHALAAAVRGCHTVLHLAACAKAWSRDPAEFVAVNVHAVETLLGAARAAGVRRLVHVSTLLSRPPYRAASVNGASRRPTPYEETKRAGEDLVAEYAASGQHAVIVHPARVFGPGPLNDANAVTKMMALYLAGRFRVRLADGDVLASYVHADDVAAGILLATRGPAGARYVLGGENLSLREFLDLVGDLAGRRRWTVTIPPAVGVVGARLAELWGRVGGWAPITPGWVRIFLEDRRADIEPARKELGYDPRPLRQGLAQTLAWMRRKVGSPS
jgi:farnesol dehydrogenase